AKMLATTLHMMQGTPYIYQGEEFGMTNPNFTSIEEYRDVESLNAYKTLKEEGKSEKEILAILKQKSRDNGRTPMQWSDEKHAGFSQGNPWINVAENYQDINADKALKDKDSIFYHYQKLIDLRKKYDIITYGDYQLMMEDHPEVFAYTRNWKNEKLVVLSNFYGNEIEIDVPLKDDAGVLISNYSDVKRNILRPYESVVFYMK
ncbi:alpha-amylase family glycosyl hydrolase, partial [Oceanobacillus caeni]